MEHRDLEYEAWTTGQQRYKDDKGDNGDPEDYCVTAAVEITANAVFDFMAEKFASDSPSWKILGQLVEDSRKEFFDLYVNKNDEEATD